VSARFLIYTETYPSPIADSPRQTGIGRYCADLAAGLTLLDHDVSVLTGEDSGVGGVVVEEGIPVRRVGTTPSSWPTLVARFSAIRRRVAAERPDFLLIGDPLAHQVMAMGGPPADVPYLPIFYGTELLGWSELFGRRGAGLGAAVRRRMLSAYVRSAYDVIVISHYTADALSALPLGRRSDCIVFPAVSRRFLEFLPKSTSPSDADGTHGRDVSFITVARVSERKNQLQVLQALAELHRREGLAFRYRIVGNVDSPVHLDYLHAIHEFARAYGVASMLEIVEHASDEEKVRLIDRSDVFVMLSRTVGHSVEGFGISVIEASCRGKPVVVSDQGGMPETVRDGDTGFVVPIGEPDRVAEPLLRLARDPRLRGRLGAQGCRFVLEHFTQRAMGTALASHLSSHHSHVGVPRRSGRQ
jgi:glycosyltransferase involved in cell wall biosynthesis